MNSKTKLLDVNIMPKKLHRPQVASTSSTRLFFKVNNQNFKEYTKTALKFSTNSPRKPPVKQQLVFSSLENPPPRISLNSPCSLYESSQHEPKSPRSGQSSLQYSQYSNYTGSNLPSFFLNERDASIACKEDIHGKIIDMGEEIHESMIQNIRQEFEKVYKKREIEMMKKCEKEKEMQLENERAIFSSKLEQLKNQLKTEYERRSKEKITESQVYNSNLANEKLEEEKIELRKQFEDSIIQMKHQFDNDRKHLIEKGMRKEREKIHHKIDDERERCNQQIKGLNEQWYLRMEQKSKELEAKLRDEFEFELKSQKENHNKIKEEELDKQKSHYEIKLQNLRREIHLKEMEINEFKIKFDNLNKQNDLLERELATVKLEFQNSIKRLCKMDKNDSDFLFTFNEFNLTKKNNKNV
ncbi:unnamed protein product [Brachionus calyciflorus]|uniref:Uncharacterized protein n=1 Tax=Brachionus calyciflorus TaxID=104777 RepID=A0A813X510_9BILA|nr:unnamed protein product [Brachionus calyciflorus]